MILSIFNNKGGVGKTTFLYHVAHLLAEDGVTVLMVDCDSQCNLTAYSLHEKTITLSWRETDGNSIYRQIEPVDRTIGDIRNRAPTKINEHLFLVPGDISLSGFEDRLGETWSSARGGNEAALRAQSALHRVIKQAEEKVEAQIILLDLGPNLGAINRAVLAGSDYIITPVSPDLFSIRGTENLGNKLVTWRNEWDQCNNSWNKKDLDIPAGRPKFLGYVTQQHNMRNNIAGMTLGWQIFGSKVKDSIKENIIDKLIELDQVEISSTDDYNLGMIPNLHSLIAYSLAARKPVFNCGFYDGVKGSQYTTARESRNLFTGIAKKIVALAQNRNMNSKI